jgi:hypothetical protein
MYWHDIHVQVQVSNNIDGHGLCTHLEAMPIHAHPKPMDMGMDMDTQCTVLVWSELGTSPAFSTNESVWSVMVTGSQSRVWSGPKSYDVITKSPALGHHIDSMGVSVVIVHYNGTYGQEQPNRVWTISY